MYSPKDTKSGYDDKNKDRPTPRVTKGILKNNFVNTNYNGLLAITNYTKNQVLSQIEFDKNANKEVEIEIGSLIKSKFKSSCSEKIHSLKEYKQDSQFSKKDANEIASQENLSYEEIRVEVIDLPDGFDSSSANLHENSHGHQTK